MDKVTCLKNLLSCFTKYPPDKIKGDTSVDVLEQYVDYFKNNGGSGGGENFTYATEEEVRNLFNR